MSIIADTVRKLFEQGATHEVILTTIEGMETVGSQQRVLRTEAQRQSVRERVTRYRERNKEKQQVKAGIVTRYNGHASPSLSSPPSFPPIPPYTTPSSHPSSLGDEAHGELFENPPKKTRSRNRPELTPIPANWTPNPVHRAKCERLGYNIDSLTDGFRNHHVARATRFASWDAAFHTWITNAERFSPHAKNGHSNGHVSSIDAKEVLWKGRLEGWEKRKFWLSEWGLRPDHPDYHSPI